MNERINKNQIGGWLIAMIIVAAMVYWFTASEVREVKALLVASTDSTRAELITLAETTGNAQIDAVTESVLQDCSDRTEYESLLAELETLSSQELLRVQDLHGDCGHYFPTVRALMTQRLEATFATYEAELAVLDSAGKNQDDTYQRAGWRSLIDKETERSSLLRQQNVLQGRIIDALVANDQATIPDLLQEAQSINGSLNVTSIQINNERAALIGS